MTRYIPLSGFNYLMQIPIFEMMTVADVNINEKQNKATYQFSAA